YLAKGHRAFAEQAFRRLREAQPDSLPLRALVADLLRRQGRPGDAADELASVVDGDRATPGLRRLVGEMELEAGRNERARDLLLASLDAEPRGGRTLLAPAGACRRLTASGEARPTVGRLPASHPPQAGLWRTRLLFEEFAGNGARAVVTRWQAAMPDFVPALEAQLTIHDVAG